MENNVIAVILAGGKSSRMGSPKGLLDLKGKTWLEHQIDKLDFASEIYIGLGYQSTAYQNLANKLGKKVQFLINPQPEKGPFSTLKHVLHNINLSSSNLLICPVDIPISSQISLLLEFDGSVVRPTYRSKSGHPILLRKPSIDACAKADYSDRLDEVLKYFQKTEVPFDDALIHSNLNTPKEWEAFKSKNLSLY
jgi:molybdenum cofactor cytidylyltransferase